jgi:pimeloyl-ACP methyl ester carboxylesterase
MTVSVPDLTLSCRVFGAGPPVLLLSGGPGGPSEELRPIADRLESGYQVFLLDQRGTGDSVLRTIDEATITMDSYVAYVEAVRRQAGLDRWILLGHSAGGAVAMSVAAAHPEQIAGLILVESAGINLEFLEHFSSNLRHTDEDRAAMEYWSDPQRLAAEPERASRESYRAWLSGVVFDRASVNRVLECFFPAPHVATISGLMIKHLIAQKYDLRPLLATLSAPALVINGRQGLMGAATSKQIGETLRNSALITLDDCGHYPMFEQPEAFFAQVDRFLSRVTYVGGQA